MKKLLLASVILATFSNAAVLQTTLGCNEKKDLIDIRNQKDTLSVKELYNYSMEHNCEIIQPSDQIRQVGKPTKDGFLSIYLKRADKTLYIFSNSVKNKFNKDNNLLNKSF